MADASALESDVGALKSAIRIILEHVGMSTTSRRQVKVHLGDLPPEPEGPVVVPDARDAEIAELRARLAAQTPSPSASAGELPASPNQPVADTTPAEAPPEVPVNAQVFPAERSE